MVTCGGPNPWRATGLGNHMSWLADLAQVPVGLPLGYIEGHRSRARVVTKASKYPTETMVQAAAPSIFRSRNPPRNWGRAALGARIHGSAIVHPPCFIPLCHHRGIGGQLKERE